MFVFTDSAKLGILYEIISKLEGQELTARHPSDGTIVFLFFYNFFFQNLNYLVINFYFILFFSSFFFHECYGEGNFIVCYCYE